MTTAGTRRPVPDKIILWAFTSIIGEVTPNMRSIAFSYGGGRAGFRFYVEEEPTDDERECGEVVAVNFESGLSERLISLDVEFVVTRKPLGHLDMLDHELFRRHEE